MSPIQFCRSEVISPSVLEVSYGRPKGQHCQAVLNYSFPSHVPSQVGSDPRCKVQFPWLSECCGRSHLFQPLLHLTLSTFCHQSTSRKSSLCGISVWEPFPTSDIECQGLLDVPQLIGPGSWVMYWLWLSYYNLSLSLKNWLFAGFLFFFFYVTETYFSNPDKVYFP